MRRAKDELNCNLSRFKLSSKSKSKYHYVGKIVGRHHANSKMLIDKAIYKITVKAKMLIKIILNEFAFENTKRLAGNSFLWKFVPFSYCPGKKRKSKNIFMSFRYNKFKIMASPSPLFYVCYQIIPLVPI